MVDPVSQNNFNADRTLGVLSALDSEMQLSEAELLNSIARQPNSDFHLRQPGTLPPITVDGSGLLVLRSGGRYTYARSAHLQLSPDGTFVDDKGRAVMVYDDKAHGDGMRTLRLPQTDSKVAPFKSFEIDERGCIYGKREGASRQSKSIPLGRLCLAVFPAPQALVAEGDDAVSASSASGSPKFFPCGDSNVGALRIGEQSTPDAALQRHLERIWTLNGRASIDTALAQAKDSFARTALGLVK